MTVNQNGLKISLGGDISLQVRHIPLPYFYVFMIPTKSGLIAENASPRTKIPEFPGSPRGALGGTFNRTPFCKNLDPPQKTCISIRTRDNSELQVGTIKTVITQELGS